MVRRDGMAQLAPNYSKTAAGPACILMAQACVDRNGAAVPTVGA
jgi:hypothetical protein